MPLACRCFALTWSLLGPLRQAAQHWERSLFQLHLKSKCFQVESCQFCSCFFSHLVNIYIYKLVIETRNTPCKIWAPWCDTTAPKRPEWPPREYLQTLSPSGQHKTWDWDWLSICSSFPTSNEHVEMMAVKSTTYFMDQNLGENHDSDWPRHIVSPANTSQTMPKFEVDGKFLNMSKIAPNWE